MNAAPEPWEPDPQLLAAYFDGELEGRDDLADMRARIERWLEAHPEGAVDWAKHRELQKAWLDTTPAEPSDAAWNETLAAINARRQTPKPVRRRPWLWVGAAAASVLVVIGISYGVMRVLTPDPVVTPLVEKKIDPPAPPKEEPIEVFEVAHASEIVIRRVEGADTSALVVGVPPVVGPLELAVAGEVRIVHVRPDAHDKMVPNVRHEGPHRPMIWARLD